jgi:hypothetical protein
VSRVAATTPTALAGRTSSSRYLPGQALYRREVVGDHGRIVSISAEMLAAGLSMLLVRIGFVLKTAWLVCLR